MSWGFVSAAVAAIGAAVGGHQANQSRKDAAGAAGRTLRLQEEEMRKAEQARNRIGRNPNKGAFYTDNLTGGATAGPASGLGGTLLTGPGGVDSSALQIGKKTLLG